MKITILGAGNVAFQLVHAFRMTDTDIAQVYNRTASRAQSFCEALDIPYTDKLSEISQDSDVYLMCVSDDGIASFAQTLLHPLKGKFVVHTSGAVDTHVLAPYFEQYGGFYPLQTFTKNTIPDFKKIPVMVTAGTDSNTAILQTLAGKISNLVAVVDDRQRLIYHLAAVIANNFSNHLFGKAADLLHNNGLEFRMILPLIEETVRKIHANEPASVQTGPARRGDLLTIRKHLDLLQTSPELRKIYIDISNSINPDLKLTL